MLRSSKSKHV